MEQTVELQEHYGAVVWTAFPKRRIRQFPRPAIFSGGGAMLKPEVIAWGVRQLLPHAQVPLRCQNRRMSERQLDLLERGMPDVREFCECPA